MPRRRLYRVIAGLLLLVISFALLLYASNAQTRRLHYGTPAYLSTGDSQTLYYFGPSMDPWVTIVFASISLLAFLIAALYIWSAARRGHLPPVRKSSVLILFASLVVGVGLTVVNLLAERPSWTAQYGEPPQSGQLTDYIAFAELSGPPQLRFGDSTEIAFTLWISKGVVSAPLSNTVLVPSELYTATAYIQAVNFDMDEFSRAAQSKQPLSMGRSAFWSWVVSPKEKRFGVQALVVRANIQDAQGNHVGGDPYLSATVVVTDPIGLPGPVYYVLMAFGGLVSLPLWAWLYKEWDARRKERQDEKIKELE